MRRPPPWEGCCAAHDAEYWRGGTRIERLRADRVLRICVRRRGRPLLAWIMFLAVRVGGHPLLPLPWRWGYGFQYPRNYTKDRRL